MSISTNNLDVTAFVQDATKSARAALAQLQKNKTRIDTKLQELNTFKSHLESLSNSVLGLGKQQALQARSVQMKEEATCAQVSVAAGTPLGYYQLNVSQLASSSLLLGGDGIYAGQLSSSQAVNEVALSDLELGGTLKEGFFTVNGHRITVELSNSLGKVLQDIEQATGVQASYDTTQKQVSLQQATGVIYLGTAADTSNFLNVFQLYCNNSNNVQSLRAVESLSLTQALGEIAFSKTLTSAGTFSLNGYEFSYRADDTLAGIFEQVNSSSAGVIMQYNPTEQRCSVYNKSTGSLAIQLNDVDGNLMDVLGLSTDNSSLSLGKNAQYSLNDGSTLTSTSNQVQADSHSIQGLELQLTEEGSCNFEVESDISPIKSAIETFVQSYNTVSKYLKEKTYVNVQTHQQGVFYNDSSIKFFMNDLHKIILGTQSKDAQNYYQNLTKMGISFDANQALQLDATKLEDAIEKRPEEISALFSRESNSFVEVLNDFVKSYAKSSIGSIQSTCNQQKNTIAQNITRKEQQLNLLKKRVEESFYRMQQVQFQAANQMQYLSSQFK